MEENKNELVAVNNEAVAEVTEANTGLPTGAAMIIGGGLTVAGIVAVKKLRKAWLAHKAKKYAQSTSKSEVEDADEFVDEDVESDK